MASLSSFRTAWRASCRTTRTARLCRVNAARSSRATRIHAIDGKVYVDRNRHADVLQNHVAFDRLGFQKRLIDENSHVFLGTQPGQCLG